MLSYYTTSLYSVLTNNRVSSVIILINQRNLIPAGPTCWNGDLGITNDHKNHMAYTLNGEVAGECPSTHPRRLPQVQLFVRIPNYQGGRYQLSDGNTEFHFDFFNGWQEGKLQQIIDTCMPQEQEIGEYNPEW